MLLIFYFPTHFLVAVYKGDSRLNKEVHNLNKNIEIFLFKSW